MKFCFFEHVQDIVSGYLTIAACSLTMTMKKKTGKEESKCPLTT
jgi:hypothetical protein